MAAVRRVLLIAYHFPPLAGSSGIQRTLRFAQQLPEFGWEPVVLTTQPLAYERTADDLLQELPQNLRVERAFCLDTARHLAIAGRYPGWLARPDRWISWRPDALRRGKRLIRELGIQALWSTYPIATAHQIGAELQAQSGLPWIADFRDPMAQDDYPPDPRTRQAFLDIERLAVERARFCTFTTPGAARCYTSRYPLAPAGIEVLENGYDEESFAGAENLGQAGSLNPGRLTLLHSGIVYPEERDPSHLFQALARLRHEGCISAANFVLRLRAPVHVETAQRLAQLHGAADLIEILPAVSYREALAEMMRAEALLVLQAGNCNDQIPAKIYEYLRSGRPMLCLTDPAGDTAGVVRAAGLTDLARLDSADDITLALRRFLAAVRAGQAGTADPGYVRRASRRGRTEALAALLDRTAAKTP